MKLAETVTFGGGGLNRAAELRTDKAKLEQLRTGFAATVLPVWRGKPLLAQGELREPVFLPHDHPFLAHAAEEGVFLGLDGDLPRFALDVSAWEPDAADLSSIGAFVDTTEQGHSSLPDGATFAELRLNMTRLSPLGAEIAAASVGVFAWHRNHGFCAKCGAKSQVSSAGWQRSCATCKAQHFPRTDPVVIMLITRGNSLLIGRSHGWPEGMYSLLAGFMEPGETIEAAVRREVFEETQIKVGEVGYLASQPWPFPSSLMIGCWGEATSEEIIIDKKEIEDAIWVTREEILEAWASKSSVLVAARKGAIAHFLIKNWLSDTLA